MTNFELLKHLNNFSKPFRKNLILVFIAIIFMTGIEAVTSIFLSKIFDIIQVHSTDPTYLDDALILVGLATSCAFVRIIISRFQGNLEIKKKEK